MEEMGGGGKCTLRACYDAAGCWSDIDACDCLIVAFELILQGEFTAGAGVELDVVVSCYG